MGAQDDLNQALSPLSDLAMGDIHTVIMMSAAVLSQLFSCIVWIYVLSLFFREVLSPNSHLEFMGGGGDWGI